MPRSAGAAGSGAGLLGLGGRPLVLASASPRRAELLAALGVAFERRPVSVDERPRPEETPHDACLRLALEKARSAFRSGEEALVLGADTVVVVDGTILGKPGDSRQAARMLRLLSGRTHRVLTAVALVRGPDGAEFAGIEDTRVVFAPLGDAQIAGLVDSGEGADKAGAYGIQGLASLFIDRIEGDYFNVVGLPLGRLRRLIEEATR